MSTLILYTTAGCHLCETAKDVLWPLLAEFNLQLKMVDIADSDELIERYGIRIPVIVLEENTGELGWPFDAREAHDFIEGKVLS